MGSAQTLHRVQETQKSKIQLKERLWKNWFFQQKKIHIRTTKGKAHLNLHEYVSTERSRDAENASAIVGVFSIPVF